MNPIIRWIYDVVYHGLEKHGRYYSDYPAYVHDNKDPENLHRIRLIIPGIADTPMEEWAWPKGLFAGPSFGTHIIPPEGSMVWVSFRLGDPNHPIWCHGHFGDDDLKNWTPKQKRINNFWFQTPQGNLVEMDDEEGTIRMTDAHGNKVETSEKGVSTQPQKGGKIFMGSLEKGDEGAAMGATTEKVTTTHHKALLGAISSMTSIAEQLTSSFTALAAASTPAGMLAAAVIEGPKIADNVKNLTQNNKVLNKSLTAINGDLKKIPSTKVIIDR